MMLNSSHRAYLPRTWDLIADQVWIVWTTCDASACMTPSRTTRAPY